MPQTYKATGINLKGMPLGESDRLLTILTREFGLIRAVARGARKQNSKISGRSGLFVVNDLLLTKGQSLDKIIQAETLESYPGLGRDLSKLTASQYLAELVLCQALTDQPQEELFSLLTEHLSRIERLPRTTEPSAATAVLAHLSHATYHLLALAGVAPQAFACCTTLRPLSPNFADPQWRVGFSTVAGGIVDLSGASPAQPLPQLNAQLNATELALFQQLAQPELLPLDCSPADVNSAQPLAVPLPSAWLTVERVLRQYSQYHFDRSIRSAALIDTCFLATPVSP